jgi:RHS repeat-associated protein
MNGSTAIARYVRGVNLLLSDSPAGQKFYLFNGHGDTVQLAGSNGAILWRYDYDSFGNEREITGQDSSLDANPFRYCAEYFDKETGSIYLRARYYAPVLGRFLTEDPIRDGLNWYAYAGGNPLYFIDPSGLAMEALRKWVETKAAAAGVSYSIGWDDKTKTATVFMSGNGYSASAYFVAGVDKTYIELATNRMIVDDNLLWAAFWQVIDPASKSLFDAVLSTIPLVSYGQAIAGMDLDGRPLTGEQRLQKLGQGLNASADALETGLIAGGIKVTGSMSLTAAKSLGYAKINYYSHGQPVYKNVSGNGPRYITPDADVHSGGVWKGADSVENLRSKATRSGTYNVNLQRIGD